MATERETIPFISLRNQFGFMCIESGENYEAESHKHLMLLLKLHRKKCKRCEQAVITGITYTPKRMKGGLKNEMELRGREFNEHVAEPISNLYRENQPIN
jgi:hypothetical protein